MRRFIGFVKKVTFHPDPVVRLIITLVYCGVGIFVNFFCLQVFCMPVLYARVLCTAFFVAILLYPFVKANWIKIPLCFLLGTGVPISVYCIFFLGGPLLLNYIGFVLEILLLGAGLLAFIPFYLLRHIRIYYRQANVLGRRIIMVGVYTPLVALCIYMYLFNRYAVKAGQIAKSVNSTEELVNQLPKNYFTERILGLHWKYHTSLSYIYDGWRPPLHDPFFLVARWFNFFSSTNFYEPPWPWYNEEAVKFYHRKFPDLPIRENCPCSYCRDGIQYLGPVEGLDSVVHSPFGPSWRGR